MLKALQGNKVVQQLMLFAFALVLFFVAGAAGAQSTDAITQQTATDVATKMLTYLGYAIAAGLTVLVATLGAQAAWRFFHRFIKA